jgi:hypothetical protein
VLTDAGRVLADHAERLVNLRQRTMSALDDVRQLRTGRLTVAANELTCLYLLPILHEYRRLYPDVHITVQRALGVVGQHPAGVGQHPPPARSVEQRPADFVLQLLDGLADGRLGPVQGLGSGGKAAFTHNRKKGFELEQFHRES